MTQTPTYDQLSNEVGALNALLNDSHPELKSWKWLFEHQCRIVASLMDEMGLLDDHGDEE